MSDTRSLNDIETRARRQLDGMRVNHDVMAYDVLRLVAAVRQANALLATPATSAKAQRPGAAPDFLSELFGR